MGKTFKITYQRNNKKISTVRNANDAIQAIDKICSQYNWRWKIDLIDGLTCGKEWCSAFVDTEGGINYEFKIIAFDLKKESKNKHERHS